MATITSDLVVHELSKGRYKVRITERGTGQSTCGWLALNRWSGDLLEDRQGFFIYLRDTASGETWSATPCPSRHPAASYEAHADAESMSWQSELHGITASFVIRVASTEDHEERTLTLRNESATARQIEVTSFLEVVLHDPRADAGHPAFLKLFVQTEYDAVDGALLAHRRPRANDERWPWMVHALAGAPLDQWETDRARFLGRGRTAANPAAMDVGVDLSQTVGNVLDPAFCLRSTLSLPAGANITLSFLLGMTTDRDAALAMVRQWKAGFSESAQVSPIAVKSTSEKQTTKTTEAPSDLRFFNGYGGFSEDGTEYVIHMPLENGASLRPPMPWINVIGHERFGLLITESGAACTWSRNSQANRLTPWSNDPVTDPHREALFIRDEDADTFWSPLPGPAPALCSHEVKHGFGYTQFHSLWSDLEHQIIYFVPKDEPLRMVRWSLKNLGAQSRRLSLFAFEQLVLGTASLASGSIETECVSGSRLLRTKHPQGGEFADGIVFASVVVSGAKTYQWHGTCDRREFIGSSGFGLANPAALKKEQALSGADGAVSDPCFAQQISIKLEAGEEIECVWFLGEAADEDSLQVILKKYQETNAVTRALSEVKAFWREQLGAIQIKTPMPEVDLMVNGWLAYQALVCRIWGRTAFYQSSGAYGFRDQLQDAAGLLLLSPEILRKQILLHMRQQFTEGDVLHWWHPEPIDRGLRTRFSDDLLWLPYATAYYVESTNDAELLDERAPFLAAPLLADGEDESYLKPSRADETGTLYEHCCRALDRSLTEGAHGLPLMGTGDWNDGMNRVGRLGKGESVWLGFFLYQILGQFAPLCTHRSDHERAERYLAYREKLGLALNEGGWDGEWYRRAYYDNGALLGTKSGTECRIDGLAQAWSVISKAAPALRANQAMDSAAEHLIDEEHGIIKLLTPPFVNTPEDPGYIKGYVAGVRENGGQYTHAACWVVKAMAELGRNNEAALLLQRLSPVWHARDREAADLYKVEPYVIAADIYGEPPHVGRGGWTWYTGSAGWMFRVAVESVLGLSLEHDRWLVLKPCVPDSWPEYRVTYRHHHHTSYAIHFTNPQGHAHKVISATLDGHELAITDGHVRIPLAEDGAVHRVSVMLG